MERIGSAIAIAALAVVAAAQQPNQAGARLTIDGHDGPPWPITNANASAAALSLVRIQAGAAQPFLLGGSTGGLVSPGIPVAGGLLDLNPPGLVILLNGFLTPLWSTNGAGVWMANVPLVPIASGISTAWQSAVADPASPAGVSLSAATLFGTTAVVSVLPLVIGYASAVNVSLVPFGFTLPFYGQSYSNIWVNSLGTVSFQSFSGDFTPSPPEFLQQMPRIAGTWCDLNPLAAGTITVRVVQSTAVPSVRVEFTGVGSTWGPSLHTFSIVMHAAPAGDIEIVHSAANGPAVSEMLCGISPGGIANYSFFPQQNLSTFNTVPFTGAPGDPIYEWFGLVTMPFYTAFFNNPWDLAGRTLSFQPVSAAAGTGYRLTVFP